MNLHEYQSKSLMKNFGLPVLRGVLCHSADEVRTAAESLGASCVIKAQVHAGGRGKAGGVKIAKSPAEAAVLGEAMLGMLLITKQTGAGGKIVRKVYVEETCAIEREYYLSMLVDRARQAICIVASAEGGTEIEEVARDAPGKIMKELIDPKSGLGESQSAELTARLGIDTSRKEEFHSMLLKLYDMFLHYDLSLIEINPLVVTKDGAFIVLDAKCSVDDNALFRQQELHACADHDEMDAKEIAADKFGLNYIALDGNIGCMVNGAGLAMATMDVIKLHGGSPANFLDVGGGATSEMVCEGFKILLSDSKVKAILVNIFGGILRCDVLAQGIVDAVRGLSMRVPLIVRLQGTNADIGRQIMKESGLAITTAECMAEAAEMAVKAAA